MAPRHQAFRHYTLIARSTYAAAEIFRVVAYLLKAVKVLSLAGPKSFVTARTMDGYKSPVAEGTSRLRVVQNRHAQLPAIAIWQKQGAKIAPCYAQQIGGWRLDQTAQVQP